MMSLDAALGKQSSSPPSSGRSSPVPRATRRTVEDGLFKADKSLKRYAAIIDRALATWEISPEEWADYISFLGRLLKAIQTHLKDAPVLPHCNAIGTRLAQCLNPALPSGVHQKALEVYTYIFSTFGSDHVAAHLHEYLPGLCSVLSFASLSARPALYSLFEDHIVHLSSDDLRPALKSLILSLLPALEEETSEDFDRAFAILRELEDRFMPDSASDALTQQSDGYFWQCLFLAVVTSPTRRQGALNYLVRRLPRMSANSSTATAEADQRLSAQAECIMSPEPGLLIRCFVCGLSDSQVLIQRGFLDLLVTHLPLNSVVLQHKIGSDDLDRIVSAATVVLLRKDMSLNRRLWSWFLGPNPKESNQPPPLNLERQKSGEEEPSGQLRYFSNFGKASLRRAVLKMLESTSSGPVVRARPFRICLSLMDRWEIGGLLVPEIFLPAMRSLHAYSLIAAKRDVAEVVRSASLFFDGVEASLIWQCLLDVIHDAFRWPGYTEALIGLFDWIVSTFNIQDEEMLTIHIPYASLYLLCRLDSIEAPAKVAALTTTAASRLLTMVPTRAFVSSKQQSSMNLPTPDGAPDSSHVSDAILEFYRSHDQVLAALPVCGSSLWHSLNAPLASLLKKSLRGKDANVFSKLVMLQTELLTKIPSGTSKSWVRNVADTLLEDIDIAARQSREIPFPVLASIISLLASFRGELDEAGDAVDEAGHLLAYHIWSYLSPELPKYHVEATKAMWQLDDLLTKDAVMAASLTALVRGEASAWSGQVISRVEAIRRFTTFWTHSIPADATKVVAGRRGSANSVPADSKQVMRSQEVLKTPLSLTLDALEQPTDPAFNAVKSWLQDLPSLEQVFLVLFENLNFHVNNFRHSLESEIRDKKRLQGDDVRLLIADIRRFTSVLSNGGHHACQVLQITAVRASSDSPQTDGTSFLTDTCTRLLFTDRSSEDLNRAAMSMLDAMLASRSGPDIRLLDLDSMLLDKLVTCIQGESIELQGEVLVLIQRAIRLRLTQATAAADTGPRGSVSSPRPSVTPYLRPVASASKSSITSAPPPQLFKCIRLGFSSPRTRHHLDQWLALLADILPTFADALFANLLPLVESFCEELDKVQQVVRIQFSRQGVEPATTPEVTATRLLEGLQMVLDRAGQCLVAEVDAEATPKETESKPGFLSNVTSGVFKAEGPPSRTAKSNSRLTVTLAIHDALRSTLNLWLWASAPVDPDTHDSHSSATAAHTALKLRNKTRHVLEQIFSVEPLESLEVIIAHWRDSKTTQSAVSTLSLLHIMQVARPKNVIPAILDALCSRTNASAMPQSRVSSLTIDLAPSDVAAFFSAYLESMEDDATDEIWSDCIAFMKDVLTNPLPHRQVLSHLLSISLLLAEKLNNTNFGEQRKMRRELGDIFQRLLTATFTTIPSSYVTEVNAHDSRDGFSDGHHELEHSMTLVPVLTRAVAKMDLILETGERVGSAVKNIIENLVAVAFHARSFPRNVTKELLVLFLQLIRKGPTAKSWKKEVMNAFNDARILSSPVELMLDGWFPILHQWSLHDKETMPEVMLRLTSPASAGIMFGVGASAARLEADRKTQLNLRRICLLLLSSPEDTYASRLRPLEEKIAELFEASPTSSPSSMIRAELFLLCRALLLSTSPFNLAPLWPIINDKLQAALMSLLPVNQTSNDFNNLTLFQGCKLLDLLIAMSPDEFQLHEWLYITDTIDAVYQPADWTPSALTDHVAEALGSSTMEDSLVATAPGGDDSHKRRPLLGDNLNVDTEDVKALPREDFARGVLRPFLSQLSIHAYEGVYGLETPDVAALRENLLRDLLDLGTIVE
ncbi:hypothetical protein DOTSEDRAFT_56330 [Dothistroma septosporum NZE10]|uniref:Uncharacterized protein n=1 Tax=Dothistroma septosporum (strain NZE10 / CBS 128990) TaxID=675120 RepID=N1PEI9_DOTSN|nr:hypothetical protein DOTSEDRAFT_56330 [Dothistroma septosporum NZE10]